MRTLICPTVECVHNEKNRCTAKKVQLGEWNVHTRYQGYQQYWKCKQYKATSQYTELQKMFREILSDDHVKDAAGDPGKTDGN